MNEHRFDGRVGGRHRGRARHRRGPTPCCWPSGAPSVVVNDLGGSMEGDGRRRRPGVGRGRRDRRRRRRGHRRRQRRGHAGRAPRRSSTPRSSAFGRIDVLVNNAGIVRWAGFPEADVDNLERHLAVHVAGSFNTTRAAWPHMVEQGYGRIVMTTSTGMFGLPEQPRVRHRQGRRHRDDPQPQRPPAPRTGSRSTSSRRRRMTRDGRPAPSERPGRRPMAPELVAPMVAFLAHEDCPVSGEIYAAGAGRFARIFIASTVGYVHAEAASRRSRTSPGTGRRSTTRRATTVPADLMDWSAAFMAHLPRRRRSDRGTDRVTAGPGARA